MITENDRKFYQSRLTCLTGPVLIDNIVDTTINQDVFGILDWLPARSIDLIFADPPYNLTKQFNTSVFSKVGMEEYEAWLNSWIEKLPRILKLNSSFYICGDWRSSASIHRIVRKYFKVRNRITWEREKGRGAKTNWKNSSEDIWFCTLSDRYTFNVDRVKLRRRVIAPYTDSEGRAKDWARTSQGDFRITHPSNLWTDVTVPFWSMPENTDHPTQKPEKLVAKIVLASSNPGDIVLDPFAGSGTTSVVAKKLNRRYIGIEIDELYCIYTERRLHLAERDNSIQGYEDGVFWERNTLADQLRGTVKRQDDDPQQLLFGRIG